LVLLGVSSLQEQSGTHSTGESANVWRTLPHTGRQWSGPPAAVESAAAVLVRSANRRHDSVDQDERRGRRPHSSPSPNSARRPGDVLLGHRRVSIAMS
jgi:hypothetical protein